MCRRQSSAGLPPEELLEAMADVLSLMHTHRGHVRVFFEHHRELPADSKTRLRAKRDAYEAMVERQFSRGVAIGLFDGPHPRIATFAQFGMCNWAYQWYQIGGPLEPRAIALEFWHYLLNGIIPRPWTAKPNHGQPPIMDEGSDDRAPRGRGRFASEA